MLFTEKYEKLEIIFIKESFTNVLSIFEWNISKMIKLKKSYHFLSHENNLSSLIESTPFSENDMRETTIILEPMANTGFTIFVTNNNYFWMKFVKKISVEMSCDAINIRMSDLSVEYPLSDFQYVENGIEKRYVRAMKDGARWEFYQEGEIMGFENPLYYKKRKIKDRLNKEILTEYLSKLGIDIASPELWTPVRASTYYFGKEL